MPTTPVIDCSLGSLPAAPRRSTGAARLRPDALVVCTLLVVLASVTADTQQTQPPASAALPLTQQSEAGQPFVLRYPATWSLSTDGNVSRLVNVQAERAAAAPPEALDAEGQIIVTTEQRRNHQDALRRLDDIRAEFTAPVTMLTIGGWPALQRRVLDTREQPGGEDDEDEDAGAPQFRQDGPNQSIQESKKPQLSPAQILRVTTAIAAGDLLVRLEGRLPPTAPPQLVATVLAIGRSVTFRVAGNPGAAQRELAQLAGQQARRVLRPPPSTVRTTKPRGGTSVPRAGARAVPTQRPLPMELLDAGLALQVINGGVASETEVAVSTNGQTVVIGQQFRFATSNNGGQTFPFTGNFPNSTGGDPSLAFAVSGAFYEGTISNSSTGINISTDNGRTWTGRTSAFTCPTSGPNQCPAGFPDQEHIAADRFNASAAGGDQLYSAWRQLNGNWGIVCSNDGGQNWGAATFTAGDFPRITVGQDGSVYVVYRNGANVLVSRFSSCTAGLAVQAGFPVTIAAVNFVTCPMAGLDRCNNGNTLSSFTIAVDDTAPNHLFVSYAQNTSATNEDVVVRDSTDGGLTWPNARVVTVNAAMNARRFMPWICSASGVAYVSWFDRRAATAANNSLTDFFGGSARVDAASNLVAGPERRINPAGTADDECVAGFPTGSANSWPGASRSPADSGSCQPQPQRGGRCRHTPNNPTDSFTSCDFNAPVCPATETCQTGGGVPKYGDYNGNTCAAGRFYTVWPSATTPPPTIGPAAGIDLYFASLVVAAGQIQIPGPIGFPDTCVGSSALTVANICNTGTNPLRIDPITSSDAQFAVITPSAGYPVSIAAGACFPFEVRFTPASAGSKSAILTVPSDDTVLPSATIAVSGNATQAAITTMIADSGDFGTATPGSFLDQPLVIANPGGCALTVTGITSSSADFQVAQVVAFPFTVAPGVAVSVPIRFRPTNVGPTSGTLTINNSAPTGARQVRVTGTGGAPRIVASVVDTGSFETVCVGASRDLDITVTNSGVAPLVVTAITSSSPEFEAPRVEALPLVVAPGTSVEVPIRLTPTTPGPKTSTITFATNDPAAPNKLVTLTATTPANELCHPPSFTSVGMTLGPAFGSSRTGDLTVTAQARHMQPFGEKHNYGFEAQGEYIYYHGRHEGQLDAGLMNRRHEWQFGVFGDFKFLNLAPVANDASLGQVSLVLNVLLSSVRIVAFGTKGFKDAGTLSSQTSFTFPASPVAGTTITSADLQQIVRAVDAFGGGAEAALGPNTDITGHLMWLRRARPSTFGDTAGLDIRLTHHLNAQFALFGEVTLNDTLVGPTNNGAVVVGFVFGRWTRPSDLSNKHTPVGMELPRVHYDLRTRPN
jgi:hypothetical protein